MATRAASKKGTKSASKKRAPAKKGSRKAASKKGGKRPAAAKKSAARKPAARGAGAKGLRVRMYRVGFGDFFLITVPTRRRGDQYILIDCGVFKGTSGTGDIGSIEEAVEDCYKTTGGKLALVIMTHRHADHIAGFSRAADTFRKFQASMVWMPYWEQFNDVKDSPNNLQMAVEEISLQLAMQFRGRKDEEAQQALDLLWDATGVDFDDAFSAAPGAPRKLSGNALALDILKNTLGKNGKNVRYYAGGDEPQLPPELEGLTAEILGPPPEDAQVFMKLTDLKKNVGQYLDSTTDGEDGAKAIRPFRQLWCAEPGKEYPAKDLAGTPINYDELIGQVDNAQPDMLAAAAKKIDTFLNNQSLVVLFRFGGKNLLFVGDAQAGNWEHWLYKSSGPDKDPNKLGPLTAESKELLQTVDFYKVGHHGSTNATPIQAVEALAEGRSGKGFVAMCSTEPGVYGNPEKGTEVPRDPLMAALGDECSLVRSDSVKIKTSSGSIGPADGAPALPRPKSGKLTTGKLYIEYSF